MKSLYLRVWLTIVALLALFALVAGLLFRQEVARERGRMDALSTERAEAWAELIEKSLPTPDTSRETQAQAVREWASRLRMPLALDDAAGERIATSEAFANRQRERDRDRGDRSERPDRSNRAERGAREQGLPIRIRLDDGRSLLVFAARPSLGPRQPPGDGPPTFGMAPPRGWPWPQGAGLVMLLGLLFVGVAAGAYPVVRRLTRRLEALKQGVESFGAGDLKRRVDGGGSDEVASVARSFNAAAERIEGLLRSSQSLLANASHELRSPLARMKMAVSMLDDTLPADRRDALLREIHTNIGELDALVEEVLLASKLDVQSGLDLKHEHVDLRGMLIEEAARVGAAVPPGAPVMVSADDRLLRRALRNLLENARRYGGGTIDVDLASASAGGIPGSTTVSTTVRISDRGAGVPADMREPIFEPFFRMPGHAEREGGVGLGLSLVRQIARRHGGSVHVEPREGGGSVFVLTFPHG